MPVNGPACFRADIRSIPALGGAGKDQHAMRRERRLVYRVLRLWKEMAQGRRFPRRDQIEPSMLGEDWANCLVIAVRSPVRPLHFVAVGDNLLADHGPSSALAGMLLARTPQVLSERRCLLIEARAILDGIGIQYRSALYPLSDDGVAIDHVLGAANYRPLHEEEEPIERLIRKKWIEFGGLSTVHTF